MRALWKGTISFGLVTIPVSLYPATKREELKFRLLRKSDHSPVNYKRVAEADGKEVAWDQIVKGHEYEKGKFVIIKDEDFARVEVEATQTVNIIISSLWTKSIRFFSISPITSKSEKVAIKHMSFFEML
jgi:DNA end-binding protein Ku